ncbi:phragmoplast orienting kinesin-1 [Dorcoceras hygrometricum]|uniref:Phragmoplast orienting kinesin-1 n=1 Tax=Dorcoceras hygrometricum TaxID=472368 RepID=A0A2Z6ZZN2_9LAMI|nr:phragmoplast orienting kinesin-1 [Dorcoceras hygrometricum]
MVAAFRTARRVSGMSSCTVPEKPVRSGLEYADRFSCPYGFGPDHVLETTRTRLAHRPSPQCRSSQLAMVNSSCDGQISSQWSTQLAMGRSTQLVVVNVTRGGQLSLRPVTACDLKQLSTRYSSQPDCLQTAHDLSAPNQIALVI